MMSGIVYFGHMCVNAIKNVLDEIISVILTLRIPTCTTGKHGKAALVHADNPVMCAKCILANDVDGLHRTVTSQ